jgi:hypothetical protein
MTITEEEFNIAENLIYFDSNIINYIFKPDSLDKDLKASIQCLGTVIDTFIDFAYYQIPYSHAHYLDINQGPSNYKAKDLENLFRFTKGIRIQEDRLDNFTLKIYQITNIQADFEYCIEQTNPSNSFDFILKPLNLMLQGAIKVASIFVPNKKHQELINRLADALSDFNNGLEIIRINKAMRNEFKELAGIKISYPNVHQLSKEKKKMDVKEMANEAIKTSFFQIQFKNYQDFFDFHKQDNITFLSKLNRWVLKLTSLAEFIGLVSEDVKSPTAFGSITNDNIHLTYGLSCQFFITADIRLYKKAKFIKSWLNLKSNVFLIDEFIEYVLRSAYFPTNEFTSKEKFAKFVFTDKEGTVIKEYTLALEQKN